MKVLILVIDVKKELFTESNNSFLCLIMSVQIAQKHISAAVEEKSGFYNNVVFTSFYIHLYCFFTFVPVRSEVSYDVAALVNDRN